MPPSWWPEVTFSMFGFPVTIPAQSCCLGMEKTPMEFIGHLVSIFREVRRVLRDDGTLWVNMGDSYAASAKNRSEAHARDRSTMTGSLKTQMAVLKQQSKVVAGLKQKDLIGIPWMLAFALREDGWYLRQDIIWAKPNCMPESVRDRCTKSHEYVFMLSKSKKYYYDHEAIKTEAKNPCDDLRRLMQQQNDNKSNPTGLVNGLRPRVDKQRGHSRRHSGFNDRWDKMSVAEQMSVKANKRSVWNVPPAQFEGDHFAVFPEELIWDMVKAGCPVDGTVLDIFGGRGTTGVVARKQDKNYVLIEMSEKNVEIMKDYMYKQLGFLMQ